MELVKEGIILGSDVGGVPAEVSRAGLGLDRGTEDLNGRDGKADLIVHKIIATVRHHVGLRA